LTAEYASQKYTYGIHLFNFLKKYKIYGEFVLHLKRVFQFSP
jgi:hypothetical protein